MGTSHIHIQSEVSRASTNRKGPGPQRPSLGSKKRRQLPTPWAMGPSSPATWVAPAGRTAARGPGRGGPRPRDSLAAASAWVRCVRGAQEGRGPFQTGVMLWSNPKNEVWTCADCPCASESSPSNQGPCFGDILLGGGLGAQNFPSGAPEPAPRAELEACSDRTKSKGQCGRPGCVVY
jgi:hypothetical protein